MQINDGSFHSMCAREAFTAQCEARALLYAVREFDLHDAVDKLQVDAVSSSLVDQIGQDAVQEIMSAAFMSECR